MLFSSTLNHPLPVSSAQDPRAAVKVPERKIPGLGYQFLARHLTPVKIVAPGVSPHPAEGSEAFKNDSQEPRGFTTMVTDWKRASAVCQADNGVSKEPACNSSARKSLIAPAGNGAGSFSSTSTRDHSRYFASFFLFGAIHFLFCRRRAKGTDGACGSSTSSAALSLRLLGTSFNTFRSHVFGEKCVFMCPDGGGSEES